MSDPAAALQLAVEAALRADASVQDAFVRNNRRVRLYDVPPTNAPSPYLTTGADLVLPLDGEGLGLAEVICTVDAWSLTDPPGKAECKAIGGAVLACLLALTDIEGFRLRSRRHERTDYLIDPGDNATAHGVVAVRFACEPLRA